jgi:hypothetical protein
VTGQWGSCSYLLSLATCDHKREAWAICLTRHMASDHRRAVRAARRISNSRRDPMATMTTTTAATTRHRGRGCCGHAAEAADDDGDVVVLPRASAGKQGWGRLPRLSPLPLRVVRPRRPPQRLRLAQRDPQRLDVCQLSLPPLA